MTTSLLHFPLTSHVRLLALALSKVCISFLVLLCSLELSKGTDKDKYKIHMKKKLLRENWENSLSLYKAKEIEGDKFGTIPLITHRVDVQQ